MPSEGRAFGGRRGAADRLLSQLRGARQSLRSLSRDPAYALASIAILGLAVGAVTTVFAVADAVLVSPLPYPDSERLVRIGEPWGNLSAVDVLAIAEQQTSFQAFGAVGWGSAALSGEGEPEQVRTAHATAGFFDALGVAAAQGRLIAPADEAPGAPAVVVLSDALAARRFRSAAAALGRSVTLDGVPHTVVGVLPPGRDELGPRVRAAVWSPLRLAPPTRRGPFLLRGVGRLRDGVSVGAANRDVAAISERIFPLWAASFRDATARMVAVSLRDAIVGDTARSIGLLAAAVLLVLLVAVVNVATLAQVRSTVRAPELALRSALGARRLSLVRLSVAEGLWVGAGAALVGLAVARLGIGSVASLVPDLPRLQEIGLDGRVVGVALAVAAGAGLLVNLWPALSALRAAGRPIGRGDAARAGSDRRTVTVRGALVATEFALALPLLLGASLLLRSFEQLQEVDAGFEAHGVATLTVSLPEASYAEAEEASRFWRRLIQEAAEAPGVEAAGLSTELPPSDVNDVNNFDLVDRPVSPGGSEHLAPWVFATRGYLDALDIALLEGRPFREGDRSEGAPPVALVSRSWASRYYPGESAVGRQMISGGCTTCPQTTVVGVVDDVKYMGLAASAEAVYQPFEQAGSRNGYLVVRSARPTAETFATLREVLARIDPTLPAVEHTLQERVDAELAVPGRSAILVGSFATAGLVLAALGLFGSMTYVVRQRRREIGLRIALGAEPGTILRMVVWRGLRQAAIGTMVGLLLARWSGRWLDSFLYGVPATDAVTGFGVTLALLLVAVAASWLPGRRAAAIDPIEAIEAD